ncbi:hypothetical protein B9T26_08190 [Acinetobacter sp. ANC 4169]|uniref:hypothetical protein n=1 Tax=Acinetobacter sp. ANC 4169 TaxID=1977879 RepID=UPI000A342A9D|nr:hypothetical protein [Acinetobacter sp. ANC 4169]OTG73726.1 hypothetical protein B9T26_08190 [Acinetobacter sp. ANC 4169]
MMIKKLMLSTWILFITLPVSAENSIQSLPFQKEDISVTEIRKICQQLESECQEINAQLWSVNIAKNKYYYLIEDKLRITQLLKQRGQYRIMEQWDLDQHQPVFAIQEDHESIIYLHPALYPLNKHSYAVALVYGGISNSLGDDSGEQNVDFIQLLPKGKTKLVFEHLPFYEYQNRLSCYRDMKDEKNNYCEDQKATILKISYRDVGLTYYEWRLSYLNINWLKNNKIDEYKQRSLTLIPFIQAH